MKFTLVTAASILACLGEARMQIPPGVFQLNIQGLRSSHPPASRFKRDGRYSNLFKRDDPEGTLEQDLDNKFTHYTIEIEVGSPGQKQKVALDTGSSDLWVIGKDNPYCAKTKKQKERAKMGDRYILCDDEVGTFDPEKSDSYHDNKTDFEISYGDTSFAKGNWGTDQIKIGDAKVKDVTFAVGEKTNSTIGVFGIGFKEYESTVVSGEHIELDKSYDNFPVMLKKQDITKSVAYSMWLNDPDAKTGNVLFGGIDHAKYKGDLQKVPVVDDLQVADKPLELTVILSSLGIKPKKDDDVINVFSNNLPVLLDSGSTNCMFPNTIISEIADVFGAEYSYSTGSYIQECDVANGDGTFVFDLSGIKIEVPFSDMLLPVRDLDYKPIKFRNGKQACQLSMTPGTDKVILGDSFLRSAYVVYDLENYEIAMAPVKFNETKSDIEAIESDIPKAKEAKSYSNTEFATRMSVNSDISYTASLPDSSSRGRLGETTAIIGTRSAGHTDSGGKSSSRFGSIITESSSPRKTSTAGSRDSEDSDDSNSAPQTLGIAPIAFSGAVLVVLFSTCVF